MIVERVGERGLRVRIDDAPLAEACLRAGALAAAVRDADPARIEDAWNGARTLLVRYRSEVTDADRATIEQLARDVPASPEAPARMLRVRYDGEDLPAIAATLACSIEEIVEIHTAATYTVAFIGFSPGFPYLLGTLPQLASLPRLEAPRPRVPAGSLAVAGGWTGIYPQATPGGWRLLGSLLDEVAFDPARTPPTPLAPGLRIRFRPA